MIKIDTKICDRCGVCISVCPADALQFGHEEKLLLNNDKCLACQRCVNVCPVAAICT